MADKVTKLTEDLFWSNFSLQDFKDQVESYKDLTGPEYEFKECKR